MASFFSFSFKFLFGKPFFHKVLFFGTIYIFTLLSESGLLADNWIFSYMMTSGVSCLFLVYVMHITFWHGSVTAGVIVVRLLYLK